jgi:hypothetical protein
MVHRKKLLKEGAGERVLSWVMDRASRQLPWGRQIEEAKGKAGNCPRHQRARGAINKYSMSNYNGLGAALWSRMTTKREPALTKHAIHENQQLNQHTSEHMVTDQDGYYEDKVQSAQREGQGPDIHHITRL